VLYLAVAVRSFRRYSTYTAATLAGIFTNSVFGVIISFTYIAVWKESPHAGGYDVTDALTYAWLAQAMIMTVGIWNAGTTDDVADRIRTGDVAVARDGVTGSAETNEALGIDVQQLAGTGPLIPVWLLARLPGRAGDPGPLERPPDSRVWVAGLAGDQPRPPTRAAPGRADPLLLERRQQPRAALGTRGAILETTKRTALLKRCL